jgi:DNA invertase Pin-like site-specific DNA recombinase
MNAILYLRFSPRPDAEEARSLEVQEERCLAYCRERNLKVLHTIRDPETSARKIQLGDRTGGKLLLQLIEARAAANIVVQKMDRIFRTIDGRIMMDDWNTKGISLHLADQGGCSINCGTAMGRFLATQIIAFAELEPGMIAERTSGAMQKYQREGRAMGGKAPYGTRNVDGKLLPEEKEKKIIDLIWRMSSIDNLSPSEISTNLNANGIPCRQTTWHHEKVKRVLRRAKAELTRVGAGA